MNIEQAKKNIEIAEKNLAEAKEALKRLTQREVKVGDIFKNKHEIYWLITQQGCVTIKGPVTGIQHINNKYDPVWQLYEYVGNITELLENKFWA